MAGKLRQGRATEISDLDALKTLHSFDWSRLETKTFDPPPHGSISVLQYMEKFGCARGPACRFLDKQVVEGKMESGLFQSPNDHRWTKYWWFKKK